MGSFTVASVWNNGEVKGQDEEPEVKQEDEHIDQFWDKLLHDKYEQYLAEKNESYGRGKRLKRQVSYTADMFEDAGEESKRGKKRKLENSDSDDEFSKKCASSFYIWNAVLDLTHHVMFLGKRARMKVPLRVEWRSLSL